MTEKIDRSYMTKALLNLRIFNHAERGKCIAMTRVSAFMSLCQRDAPVNSLYCKQHRS